MPILILTSLSGIALLASIVRVLRTNEMRQSQAALWIGIGLLTAPVMFFPALIDPMAEFLHLESGADLALSVGLMLLVFLGIGISREHHALRNRSRILAAELGSLRSQVGLVPDPVLGSPIRSRPPAPRKGEQDRSAVPAERGPLR